MGTRVPPFSLLHRDCAHRTNYIFVIFVANVASSSVTMFEAMSGRVLRSIPIG
jgi:hypothetical protein